jgi:D-psicose/D-tagatose/L-ribulose 3-epimerase
LNKRLIAISNIAWSGEESEPFLDLVASEGVRGIELAASLIWDEPLDASSRERDQFRAMIESKGLMITGLHSLLFSCSDLQLLATGDDGARVMEYLRRTVDLCADLGGHCLVLGGSKNRLRGNLSTSEAKKRGIHVLRDLGNYAASKNCYFALEALPPPVCNFVMSLSESIEIVSLAESSGLRVHFDSGAASVTEQDQPDIELIEMLKKVSHCQVNDFELLPPGSKKNEEHKRWARLLDIAEYAGWVSIEMRRSDKPIEAIRQAIRFVKSTYSIELKE